MVFDCRRYAGVGYFSLVAGLVACGPIGPSDSGSAEAEAMGETSAPLLVTDGACVVGTAEVTTSYAAFGPAIKVLHPTPSEIDYINAPEVYVGQSSSCTQFWRHQWGARVSNLAVVRANTPQYPYIAMVNADHLATVQSVLPKLTITNGHVTLSQLTNLLTNSQCQPDCRWAAKSLMSSTAGTPGERGMVASALGLSSEFAGVLYDYGVLLNNRSGAFTSTDVAAIRETLSALPFPVVEMIHSANFDSTLSPGGSMGAGGDLLINMHQEPPGTPAPFWTMPDGTVIPFASAFKNIFIHEVGHQVDARSVEQHWRYDLLYERGKNNPLSSLPGNNVPSRAEDFPPFFQFWFADTRALLTQVQRRNNPVFSCKVAHVADLLSYESTTSVPYYKAMGGNTQRLGTLSVTRSSTPVRPGDDGWITAIDGIPLNCPRNVLGDVDRDGAGDLMLTGASGWTSIPVGFSNRDGTYRLTQLTTPSFPASATVSGAKPVAGDFNTDGRWDLALVGGAGVTTIPVAYSNGDGTFNSVNVPLANSMFATWAQTTGAQPVAGDWNGNGSFDLALTGAAGWTGIPFAFSNGPNVFTVGNDPGGPFPGWAASGGKVIGGDFDGDGKSDMAVVGATASTLPVAFSWGGGAFRIMNQEIGSFEAWGIQSKPISGDFDGDGRTDIALVGGKNAAGTPWDFVPVAFSNGSLGTFRVTSATVGGSFGTLATAGGVQSVASDVDGDGRADIVLAGGASWNFIVTAFSNGDGTFRVVSSSGGNNAQITALARTGGAKLRSAY